MAHVTVTINGRQFRMACDDGQEGHLERLGALVDDRIHQLRTSFGDIGEVRLTVMAAIMIADDLADSRNRLKAADDELAGLRDMRDQVAQKLAARDASLAEAFSAAADKVERLAAKLTADPS